MSAQAKVYVVTADAPYETRTPIAAYASREAADAFVESCRVYASTYRPFMGDADSGDDCAKWDKRYGRWASKHPAGREWASYMDEFSVSEVPLHEEGDDEFR